MRAVSRGFSLLEVLVAVVVFSLGLLGTGALVASSIKNSHNAYLRSQASFLADSLIDRMRANPSGAWSGAYAGALGAGSPSLPACGGGTTGCTPAQVAQRDRRVIGDLVAQQLPAGSGNVTCAIAGAAPATTIGIPPVNGNCTIAISWSEARDVDRGGYAGTQTFEVVVQP